MVDWKKLREREKTNKQHYNYDNVIAVFYDPPYHIMYIIFNNKPTTVFTVNHGIFHSANELIERIEVSSVSLRGLIDQLPVFPIRNIPAYRHQTGLPFCVQVDQQDSFNKAIIIMRLC